MPNWTEEDLAAHLKRISPSEPKWEPLSAKSRHNKYGVAPKDERTVDGVVFASKAEAHVYSTLLLMEQAGQITKLERQPEFKFPPGFKYIADFRITYANGSVEVIDVKGFQTPVFRIKKLCMDYFYPDVNLVIW